VKFFRDPTDQSLRERFLEGQGFDAADAVHGFDKHLVIRRDRLTAEFVVNFQAVIIGRIVGRGKIDAAERLQLIDDKRKFRRAEHGGVGFRIDDVGGDSVAGVNFAREL
jgi:hypothetical protein